MTRLPIPNQDNDVWGNILNDFLSVEHNADGTLKEAGDIATAKAQAASAVQTVNGKSPTSGAVTLTASDVGALTQAAADTRYLAGIKQTSAPSSPSTNDLWYDSTNDQLKRWNGSIWASGAGVAKTVGAVVTS